MTKSKTKSEIEHLRGVIKELKKELRRKEKREHQYADLEQKEADQLLREESEVRTYKNCCPECSKGELEIIEIGLVTLTRCTICKFRQTRRNKA